MDNKIIYLILGVIVISLVSVNADDTPFSYTSSEVESPGDWVKENQIMIEDDKIIIFIDDAQKSSFADTNSMDPVFDSESNAIKVVPNSIDDLEIGDIISYKSKGISIIHRIVDIRQDAKGVYFVTKGDNNKKIDSSKVRFDQITGVVIAILY